jgi:RimJ/RimL family protein N-acetyltransferase
VLREPKEADARLVFEAYTRDPEVARYMVWRPHADLAETEAFIAGCIQAWGTGTRQPYVLARRKAEQQPIGMLEARVLPHTIDIGYVLARAHWGQGLMPEAIGVLTEALLATPGFFRVQATCDIENRASARTLEKSGFLLEGRLDRYMVHPNVSSEPRACFMYARCR